MTAAIQERVLDSPIMAHDAAFRDVMIHRSSFKVDACLREKHRLFLGKRFSALTAAVRSSSEKPRSLGIPCEGVDVVYQGFLFARRERAPSQGHGVACASCAR